MKFIKVLEKKEIKRRMFKSRPCNKLGVYCPRPLRQQPQYPRQDVQKHVFADPSLYVGRLSVLTHPRMLD